MNQVPTALQALAGVSASTVDTSGSRSVLQLTNTETPVQALQGFDFTEYYDVNMPFYENYTETGLINVGYTPVKGAQILGKYLVRNDGVDSADTSATSAAIVKHQPVGTSGYVYSFGMDLGYLFIQAQAEAGGYSPWYDGHYYPGYDIGTRVIKNIVTTSPHFVSLWSVPFNKGLAFTTTWDIDTYVSYPHGQGIAAAAQDRGAAGNLNLHTKYVTDAYETAYFQYGVPYIYSERLLMGTHLSTLVATLSVTRPTQQVSTTALLRNVSSKGPLPDTIQSSTSVGPTLMVHPPMERSARREVPVGSLSTHRVLLRRERSV
jgi:hypothetical protein